MDWTLRDGRSLRWWEGGDPVGVPVIFFHGCPDTRHAAFPGDSPARDERVRLVAFNRPGYEGSTATGSDHLSVADDAVELADGLGIGRFAVLGMSIGGGYALACAARHPERVSGAAVVAAPGDVTQQDPPTPRDGLSSAEVDFFVRLASTATVEAATDLVRPDYEAWADARIGDDPDDTTLVERFFGALPPLDEEAVRRLPTPALAAAAREALADRRGYLRDAAVSFRPWAFDPAHVRCPTVLWYGAQDPQHSTRQGAWLVDRLPRARLDVNPGTAHLSTLLTQWDAILRELRLLASGP
jgi:pimeloyl-ACP methyl ester carboxylesterase